MKLSILIIVIFLFGTLFLPTETFAHDVEYVTWKEKTVINTGTTLYLTDPLYNDPNEGVDYVSQHNAVVSLVYGREDRTDIAGQAWFYEVNYDLIDRTTGSRIGFGTVRIEHNNTEGIYESSKVHENVIGTIAVRVTSINATPSVVPNDIRLEAKLNVERYDYLDEAIRPNLVMSGSTPNSKVQTEAHWAYIPGAEYYELEWVYWDAENDNTIPIDDEELFKQAIRIQTNDTYYKLDLVYPKGVVYFRVRPVGRFIQNGADNSIEKRGIWSDKEQVNIVTGFEEEHNWSFSRAFAEDGKHKQAISYFDDGLKGRQSLTTLSSESTTIVAESVYDVENRASLAIMPVPVENNQITGSNLQFGAGHSNHLITTGGVAYSRTDFDQHNVINPTAVPVLPATHIANQYYSNANPFSTHIHQEYTPDAEGYPIAQVKYKNDGRGYVESQSGVGKFYQLQTKRESKYYYTQPTTTELQSFFGANVGQGKFYRKNYAIDANGQAAVSIVDQAGQTIMTALAGNIPNNVQDLDGSSKVRTETLMGSNTTSVQNQSSTLTHNLFCDGDNVNYDFEYDLETAVNIVNGTHDFCLGCTYDLEIEIRDANNSIVPCTLLVANPNITLANGRITASYSSSQTTCNGATYAPATNEIKFRAVLPSIGSYTIYKTLRATGPNAADILASLQDNGSVMDQQTFIDNYILANFDSTECTECSDAFKMQLCQDLILADNPDLNLADSIDLLTFQQLLNDCINSTVDCDELQEQYMLNQIIGGKDCEAMLMEMKGQLSPGGCLYEQPTGIHNRFYREAFDDGMIIPNLPLNTSPFIVEFDQGPLVGRGNVATYLQDPLQWQDSWIDTLVYLHPEYCRYIACVTDPALSASKHFDYDLASYQDWEEVATELSISISNPITATDKRSIITYLINNDPFLGTLSPVGGGTGSFTTNNPIDYSLSSYCTDQYALAPSGSTLPPPCACGDVICFLASGGPLDTNVPATEEEHWDMFRGIYMNLKQNLFYAAQCTLDLPAGYTSFPSINCQEITGEPIINSGAGTMGVSGLVDLDALQAAVQSNIQGGSSASSTSTCNQLCASRADDWIDDICPGLAAAAAADFAINPNSQIKVKYDGIRSQLINYCTTGCGSITAPTVPTGNPYLANPMGYLLTEDLNKPPFTTANIGIIALLDDLEANHNLCVNGSSGGLTLLTGISVSHSTRYQLNITYNNLYAGLPVQNPKCSLLNNIFTELDQNLFPVRFSTVTGLSPSSRYFTHTNVPVTPASTANNLIGVPAYSTFNNDTLLAGLGGLSHFSTGGLARVRLYNTHIYDNDGYLEDIHRFIQFSGEGFDDPCSNYLGIELIHAIDQEAINPLSIISLGAYDCVTNSVTVEYATQPCAYPDNTTGNNTSLSACGSTPTTETVQAYVRINAEPCAPSWEIVGDSTWIPIVTTVTVNIDSAISECDSAQILALTQDAQLAYQNYINSVVNDILVDVNCVPVEEKLMVSYISTEQHYTLYYYDEAGNLVQTLPPAAIVPLDMNDANNALLGKIKPGVHPKHNFDLLTTYTYNTLGQVTSQHSPDGGLTKFFYDYAQRLRLSQNARQAPTANNASTYGQGGDYAYTKFDKQGRVIEVGKLDSYVVNIDDLNTRNFPQSTQYSLSERTTTEYDNSSGNGSMAQNNLRSRVARTYNENIATYYDYDIHGNVKKIQHQIKLFGTAEIEYDYDLITGNVNEVAFQKGNKDQFFHRYHYDADNRLTKAQTSKNSYLWDTDARYFYYAHGPLARVEIGEDNVQGMDYYYNLQGWMKGVNNTSAATDLGKDGDVTTVYPSINKNKWFGKDEYAYHLGYHREDYKPIGGSILGVMEHTATSLFDSEMRSAAATGSSTTGLFNGNIAFMITHIPELEDQPNNKFETNAMVYQYDALHRIKQAKSFHLSSSSTWTRDASTEWYDTDYSYDANGNIQTLKRYNKGTLIDDLEYNYKTVASTGANPNLTGTKFNQLDYVVDQVTPVTVGDFKNQSQTTYEYDAVGNLIADASQEIRQGGIEWNLMNKIDKVSYDPRSGKTPLEFTYDASGSRLTKTSTISNDRITTVYIRDAGGNIMATYEMVDEQRTNVGEDPEYFPPSSSIYAKTLKETVLYGASRLGVRKFDTDWDSYLEIEEEPMDMSETLSTFVLGTTWTDKSTRGDKLYESSNHLGNVLVTFSDKKLGQVNSMVSTKADFYEAIVTTASDYYPFGWSMPNRKFNTHKYSYGFNGQIQDHEWMGGQSVAFEFRTQDARLGRFLSTDPLTATTPWETPYAFAGNGPIKNIDWLGLKAIDSRSSRDATGTKQRGKGGKSNGRGLNSSIAKMAKKAPPTSSDMMGVIQNARDNAGSYGQQLNLKNSPNQGTKKDTLPDGRYIWEMTAHEKWLFFGSGGETEWEMSLRLEELARSNLPDELHIGWYERLYLLGHQLGWALPTSKIMGPGVKTFRSRTTIEQFIKNKAPGSQIGGIGSRFVRRGVEVKSGLVLQNGKGYTSHLLKEENFIITLSGELRVGVGHDFLSEGARGVKMAGSGVIVNGKFTKVTPQTGHFQTTMEQAEVGLKMLKEMGVAPANLKVTPLF